MNCVCVYKGLCVCVCVSREVTNRKEGPAGSQREGDRVTRDQ